VDKIRKDDKLRKKTYTKTTVKEKRFIDNKDTEVVTLDGFQGWYQTCCQGSRAGNTLEP